MFMSLKIELGSLLISLNFWVRLVLGFMFRAHPGGPNVLPIKMRIS